MNGKRGEPPRHFFVNERHELSREEKEGGGSAPKYTGVNWAQKGKRIQSSVRKAREEYHKVPDPVKTSHYFLIATPDKTLKKTSDAKGKKGTIKDEPADFATNYPQVFHRLGMDLLRLDSEGRALVHMSPERVEAIETVTGALGASGLREQARWAPISEFQVVPWTLKVDSAWLKTLKTSQSDVILELQPLLTRTEVDRILGGVAQLISSQSKEVIQGSGTDYSGRQWFRAKLGATSIEHLAKSFHSIQSFHPPLATTVQSDILAGWTETQSGILSVNDPDLAVLPTVGILDTGVEDNHPLLSQYFRNRFIAPQSLQSVQGNHGTGVASKVVFGHCNPTSPQGLLTKYRCKYLDVVITKDASHIEDKAVLPGLENSISNFRDVRVFNLSFGDRDPLENFSEQDRLEKLAQLRDLDNLIFSEDVIVVVAAGNSPPGLIPNPQYPDSYKDPKWRLPSWARGFNTLVCGSSMDEIRSGSMTGTKGLPSPFTRVGPGISDAPTPGFSEHGGDVDATYRKGFGVAVCNRYGVWRETCGTSYAAPLLARKAAYAIKELQRFCHGNSRPYASLVRAFMALSASPGTIPSKFQKLAEHTLGRGKVNLELLFNPDKARAIFFWQGVLDSPNDILRIQIPIPQTWIGKASDPKMRIIWSWETPVHDGVPGVWACRRVDLSVRSGPDSSAFRGSVGDHNHGSYTIREKVIDLDPKKLQKSGIKLGGDLWLLEISYRQLADYYPGREFSPKQRAGVVAELFDDEQGESPQKYLQALSIASTFDRLSVATLPTAPPVPIKL